jgi:iron only hydrogenase large subunit-like protein
MFSGAVMLADISDLGPSLACIKPLMPIKEDSKSAINKGAKIQIDLDGVDLTAPKFSQIKINAATKSATVSLNDCLACSGCVTSAETVLINMQSLTEFLSNVHEGKKTVVITLAPQAVTSLALKYGLSNIHMAQKLTTVFKSMNVRFILDATCGQDVALVEAQAEFVNRFRNGNSIPVLSSECPGWICYAEKTQGKQILPFISTVKSPQQIIGAFVKKQIASKLQIPPNLIFHVTIMPCFDKKLEGSRNDFFDEMYETRDVDCVLTTSEIVTMLEDNKVDIHSIATSPLDTLFSNVNTQQNNFFGAVDVGASGGYLENIFRFAAKSIFHTEITGNLQYQRGRNPDWKEVSLTIEGKEVLRFVQAYGFRNIQNVMRAIKKGDCPFHYVEIMACPSGCLNGGGQNKLAGPQAGGIRAQKKLLTDLDELYHQRETRAPEDNPTVLALYREWVQGEPASTRARSLLHTQYHDVGAADINPLAIRW